MFNLRDSEPVTRFTHFSRSFPFARRKEKSQPKWDFVLPGGLEDDDYIFA